MDFLLWENEHFRIEHCYSCSISGYLIVSPVSSVDTFVALNKSALYDLGLVLARASKAIQEVVDPEKLYCASFGEEHSGLHFHLFPRTKAITDEFVSLHPDQSNLIHGPLIFDWAREQYKSSPEEIWVKIAQHLPVLKEQLCKSRGD